jgi:dTMP kinase
VSGRFIVFEGGEGSGKTTQARRLADRLGATLTREPGGTLIGARLRDLLLDPEVVGLDVRTEALLMAADRAQHVAEVIAPALAAGGDVVGDRFVGSSLAYQGHGRGLDLDDVRALSTFAVNAVRADLVLLLDVDPQVAATRLSGAPDRLEGAGAAFHQRVRAGYLALADAEPDRWVVVDGDGPVDEVASAIAKVVDERFGGMSR